MEAQHGIADTHEERPDGVQDATPRNRPASPGLLEALVGLAIVISLSGVVMPVVGSELAQGRMTDAWADMQAIAEGLNAYSRDTLTLPTGERGRTNVGWLYGAGAIPAGNDFGAGGEARALEDALLTAALGGPAWNGPYVDVASLGPDPWGQAYIVNSDGWINGRRNPFVISAGPDGVLQTTPYDREAAGDDLLYMLP